jgi:hypothetical protein
MSNVKFRMSVVITLQLRSAEWCYQNGGDYMAGSRGPSGTEEPPVFGVLAAVPATQANPHFAARTSDSSRPAIDSVEVTNAPNNVP